MLQKLTTGSQKCDQRCCPFLAPTQPSRHHSGQRRNHTWTANYLHHWCCNDVAVCCNKIAVSINCCNVHCSRAVLQQIRLTVGSSCAMITNIVGPGICMPAKCGQVTTKMLSHDCSLRMGFHMWKPTAAHTETEILEVPFGVQNNGTQMPKSCAPSKSASCPHCDTSFCGSSNIAVCAVGGGHAMAFHPCCDSGSTSN